MEDYGEGGTKTRFAMVPTPGAVKSVSVGETLDRCRGLYWSSKGPAPDYAPRLYGVWGNDVYRFKGTLTQAIKIGSIGNDGKPVSMCDNGFVFCVADGENVYTYDLEAVDFDKTSFKQIELPIVPGSDADGSEGIKIQPTHICYMAIGYRLAVNGRNSNVWFYSNLASKAVTFGQSDWYSNVTADNIKSMRVVNGDLWLFNNRSYAIFRPNDNQDNPFSYVSGSTTQVGVHAPWSVSSIENKLFWLGSSDVGSMGVYMGESISIKRISTMGIENQLATLSQSSSAISFSYSSDGNIFYVLSFVEDNRTFVYEATTDRWSERLMRDIQSGDWEVYPYQFGTHVNGSIYCGMIAHENCLVKLDPDSYTEWDGRAIVRERISPVYHDNIDDIMIKEIVVDMEVGTTGKLTGAGSDPQISLRISKDGGNTFGNSKPQSIGGQGKYNKKVRWISQGKGRQIVLKLTIAEPVSCAIYNARLDYEKCLRN
jgi:hypothetical protein